MVSSSPMKPDLVEHLLRFCRALRSHGFSIGPGEEIDMFRALEAIDIGDREEFTSALRLVLCSDRDEQALFDTLFERFLLAAESDAGGRPIQLIPETREVPEGGAASRKGEKPTPPRRMGRAASRPRRLPGGMGWRRFRRAEPGRALRTEGRNGTFPSHGWPASAPPIYPGDRPPKFPTTAWRRCWRRPPFWYPGFRSGEAAGGSRCGGELGSISDGFFAKAFPPAVTWCFRPGRVIAAVRPDFSCSATEADRWPPSPGVFCSSPTPSPEKPAAPKCFSFQPVFAASPINFAGTGRDGCRR